MTQDEYNELKARVDAVTQGDVHLGRVLALMASHLPGYSEAEQAQADAAKAEQEAAQAEADAATASAAAEQPATVESGPVA